MPNRCYLVARHSCAGRNDEREACLVGNTPQQRVVETFKEAATYAPITTGSGSNRTPNFASTLAMTRCAKAHSSGPLALP